MMKCNHSSLATMNAASPSRASAFISSIIILVVFAPLTSVSAVDGDGDGLDDSIDDCPYASGNSTIGYSGCPDGDGDGNPDFVGASTGDWGTSIREVYYNVGGSGFGSIAHAVSWEPDGVYFAGAGRSGVVKLFSSSGQTISTLYTLNDDVRSLAFSPNGSYLALSGDFDSVAGTGRVLVLEMNWASFSASIVANLSSLHSGDIYSVSWTSNGSHLLTGGEGRIIRMFEVNTWTVGNSFEMPDIIYNVATTPDSRLVASTHGEESSLNITSNGSTLNTHHNHSAVARGMALSPDGRWLLTSGDDGTLYVYNTINGSYVTEIHNGFTDINQISFHPSGAYFVFVADSSSAKIYRTSDWSSVGTFATLGSSNSRGARDVAWSPDGLKIAFAQTNGRISLYVLPEAYIQVKGEITGELMMNRWRSNFPSHLRPLLHMNQTLTQATQALCNGESILSGNTVRLAEHIASPLANHSISGLSDCTSSPHRLLEIPVGRMPAAFLVKQGGFAEACLSQIGGLSMGQLRWVLSAASDAVLVQPAWAPPLELTSVAPNNDVDGVREWSDLHSSCPQEPIHVFGRWDNRSVPIMTARLLTCADCQFAENFFTSSSSRFRTADESRSDVLYAISQLDNSLGFTEMRVTENYSGITVIPIADNWTHGAADHISAGGVSIYPSYYNSSNGTYPAQADYLLSLNEADLAKFYDFLNWMLSDSAQNLWHDIGFVRLGILSRVEAWARLGVNASHLLPDADGDGVWDGDDSCAGTWLGESVDENGCATHQIDSDGDGFFDHEDDCINESGQSITPSLGCPDRDLDGWMDSADAFPDEASQWADGDNDTFGDNSSGVNADDCPLASGSSTRDRLGCPDSDGDGWSDEDSEWGVDDGADAFPLDPEQWIDSDGDGWGDNYSFTLDGGGLRVDEAGDAYPTDPTQWADRDGDGYGDNPEGQSADDCADLAGTSTEDALGCPDQDGDGWSDGVDVFIDDGTQWDDLDGDGFGDNWAGDSPDHCIETPTLELPYIDEVGCGPSERDNDSDGIMDDLDLCPNTPLEHAAIIRPNGCAEVESDDDGDGVMNPDDGPDGVFSDDPTQSADSDGDGYGDNSSGTDGDACPNRHGTSSEDRRGCPDEDGDGYSDPESGWGPEHGADAWKVEPTQWSDADGDGFYDNYDNPAWTATREEGWPGQYVSGARLGDKCPLVASENSYPDPGCPPEDVNLLDYSDSGSSSSGLPTSLIVVLVLIVLGLVGLSSAIVVKQKQKRAKKLSKRRQRGGIKTSEVMGASSGSDEHYPHWELLGEMSDDGYEWLEWPTGSEQWWYRNEEGYWEEWV